MLSKNPLWNKMAEAVSFATQKERTAMLAGVGERPKGAELRRITNAIHKDLDNEINEDDFVVDDDMKLDLPDIMWDTARLRSGIPDMEGIEFWL